MIKFHLHDETFACISVIWKKTANAVGLYKTLIKINIFLKIFKAASRNNKKDYRGK
jgi:hypothetical protein